MSEVPLYCRVLGGVRLVVSKVTLYAGYSKKKVHVKRVKSTGRQISSVKVHCAVGAYRGTSLIRKRHPP